MESDLTLFLILMKILEISYLSPTLTAKHTSLSTIKDFASLVHAKKTRKEVSRDDWNSKWDVRRLESLRTFGLLDLYWTKSVFVYQYSNSTQKMFSETLGAVVTALWTESLCVLWVSEPPLRNDNWMSVYYHYKIVIWLPAHSAVFNRFCRF